MVAVKIIFSDVVHLSPLIHRVTFEVPRWMSENADNPGPYLYYALPIHNTYYQAYQLGTQEIKT